MKALGLQRVSIGSETCFNVEMAIEMEERSRRIVETAVELAEQGGFEAVRLRDVASHAGVALGTLYRRFRSKEDLLIAAMELETEAFERRMRAKPVKGADELERVVLFFGSLTKGLLRRPNLARALIRAVASGEPELARRVGSFHSHVENMVVATLRGDAPGLIESGDRPPATSLESKTADALELLWFALLVGWSGGVHSQSAVVERMASNAELVLRGSSELH